VSAADRDEAIEQELGVMRDALEAIANYGDCDYVGNESERPRPCRCPQCRAKRALETADRWRYMGARHDRIHSMPREAAMMKAWERYFDGRAGVETPDYRLAMVLGDITDANPTSRGYVTREPSPRDWYVASSVVQWLATNVGSAILYEAGFDYKAPKPPKDDAK
jgi:hypothetical protein